MMADKAETESSLWLCEELARQWTQVLEAMTGQQPLVTFEPHELSAQEREQGDDGLLWWEQHFTLAPDALIWVGASRQSWEGIGNQILQGAGVEDGDADSIRSTYLEIVNQALSGVATALSSRARQEVACAEGNAAPPVAAPAAGYSFDIALGASEFRILATFSQPVAGLQEAAVSAAEPPKRSEPETPQARAESAKPSAIDLLLDVELPVSVSFGRAQLPLKDVIKLTTGSIVELNRAVSEPVDVIVNNCVIARGEVVVVEGNFGIRIRQVISRHERLRTLY